MHSYSLSPIGLPHRREYRTSPRSARDMPRNDSVMSVIATRRFGEEAILSTIGGMSKIYYVYIATNDKHYVLYTGVTNDIRRRIYEHTQGIGSTFTKSYKISKLVYFEEYNDINEAIAREKNIKAGSRKKKIDLINKLNPEWSDLYSTY